MTGFLATVKRETIQFWFTPIAWVLLVALLVTHGVGFVSVVAAFATNANLGVEANPISVFFGQSVYVPLAFLFLCPTLTMRSFAEERRSGTIENLLSAPVSLRSIVLGKYAAAILTFVLLWCPSFTYVVMLRQVTEIDWHTIATSYLSVGAIGAGLLSVGMLCSALAPNQFTAVSLSAGLVLLLVFLGNWDNALEVGMLHSVLDHVSLQAQLAEMSRGVVSLRRLVFDATLVGLPLLFTTRLVDSWRWS